jgi:hypothetical protein
MGYVLGKLENDPVAMFNPFAENSKCVLMQPSVCGSRSDDLTFWMLLQAGACHVRGGLPEIPETGYRTRPDASLALAGEQVFVKSCFALFTGVLTD